MESTIRLPLVAICVLGAAVGSASLTALGVASRDALARNKVLTAQLDGDEPRERVLVEKKRCPEVSGYGCSRVELRDGSRSAVLTPFSQRPRYDYGWKVRKVRFHDFTGDGSEDVAWELVTSGGTGSSPTLLGVDRWSGRRASRIFRFSNDQQPPRGYRYVIAVRSRILAGAEGLPEIKTVESLHRRQDGTCCPSAYRITRHRWNGTRIAPVPGSRRIEPASTMAFLK